MAFEDDFIPRNLNEHPPALRGCSWAEISMVNRLCLLYSFPAAIGVTFVFQISWFFGVLLVGVFYAIFFMYLTKKVAKEKRGKPVGYFETLEAVRKQKKGKPGAFVQFKSTPWEVTRR